MRKVLSLFLMVLLFGVVSLRGQNRVISGRVTMDDGKMPLTGVTVNVKGTQIGTGTDADGNYKLSVPQQNGQVLVFSFIGMETVELSLEPSVSIYSVDMKDVSQKIDELVVVAYGTRRKGTLTGSVSVVGGEKMENAPVANFAQAMQGRVAGLQVMANSGEPSAPVTFQIRGVNSINAGTEPLFIIDGIPVSAADFSAINPNDIESQSVLKDAASTSIYGARAANGVVVITTKRGKMADHGKIQLRTQYGFSNLAYGKWNMMNTQERLQYEEEVGLRIPGTYDREMLEKTNIDWRDVVYNNNAPLFNADLSVSGASEKLSYFSSVSYFDQQGISVGSDYERMGGRINLDYKAKNWFKVGTNINISHEKFTRAVDGDYYTNTPISASKFMLPYWNPYRADGSIASIADGSWIGVGENPIEWQENNPENRNKTKLILSGFLELNPLRNLIIRTTAGIDAMDYRSTLKSNPSYLPNFGKGSVSEAFRRYQNWSVSNTASYRFSVGDVNNFNVMIGQEAVKYDQHIFSVSSNNQSSDKLLTLGYGTAASRWNSGSSSSSYLSFFSRVEYNLKDKYFADLSLRRDGSSKFGANAKWSDFWSAGLMWNLKLEDKLAQLAWLSTAQINASVGTSGNSSIPEYYHLALVSGGAQYDGTPGIIPATKGERDLTWEKLRTINLGVKTGYMDNRLTLNLDLYHKHTSDMLMQVPISLVEGYKMKWTNVGAMVNKGVEAEFSYDLLRTPSLVWNVGANVSYNHNEIVELYNGKDEYEMANTGTFLKVGHSVGEFYVNRFAGVNPINGDPLWFDKQGKITNQFDPNDKVLVGKNYNSPWQGGFNTAVMVKGFTLSAYFAWMADRYMMNNDRFFDESNGLFDSFNQSSKMLYDRWKKPGDMASVPRYGVAMQFDDRLLEDASFLRLKNLSLGYDLPQSWLSRLYIQKARVYTQAQNLFTFTSFQGMDPEVNANIYSANYPLSRQFTFGVEVTF